MNVGGIVMFTVCIIALGHEIRKHFGWYRRK